MHASHELRKFLSLEPENRWMMSPVERLVIVGLLEILKPNRSLELGHRFGGCTEYIAKYSREVVSVDIDETVLESCKRWKNVEAMHADSSSALMDLSARGKRFDFALIDADHSFASARDDLLKTAALADTIVLHDSFNPECRSGYLAALEQLDVYSDLDLADGHIQSDGLWGGLGVVVTSLKRDTKRHLTPRILNADILAHQQKVLSSRRYRLSHAGILMRSLRRRPFDYFSYDGRY